MLKLSRRANRIITFCLLWVASTMLVLQALVLVGFLIGTVGMCATASRTTQHYYFLALIVLALIAPPPIAYFWALQVDKKSKDNDPTSA
jgi:hypothetical protein